MVMQGADREILKRSGGVCWSPWLADEEKFRFQMVYKRPNNVRNHKFLVKHFYHHCQIFSIFIYNESLPMKSYQFFKICKRFDKEREKTLMQQSMRKERLRKVGLCFITGCFMKSFNMIINNFLFRKLIQSPIFAF